LVVLSQERDHSHESRIVTGGQPVGERDRSPGIWPVPRRFDLLRELAHLGGVGARHRSERVRGPKVHGIPATPSRTVGMPHPSGKAGPIEWLHMQLVGRDAVRRTADIRSGDDHQWQTAVRGRQ
jgi:hypothetical protein